MTSLEMVAAREAVMALCALHGSVAMSRAHSRQVESVNEHWTKAYALSCPGAYFYVAACNLQGLELSMSY